MTVFNANLITYARTCLIIPIAWSLKYVVFDLFYFVSRTFPVSSRHHHTSLACFFVVLHGFLDHIDGIVARVQKRLYGEKYDELLLGNFLDGFCDKIVNVFCLWTLLQTLNFEQTSLVISIAFVLLCYTTMAMEVALAIIRVHEYFYALLNKNK